MRPLPGFSTARSWRIGATLTLVLLVAACSVVRVVYNQAANLAYWQLNKAFDLNDAQVVQVKEGLNSFFKWHRQTELPVYAPLLQRAAVEAQSSLTPELACERRAEFETVGLRSADRVVPLLAQLLRTLSPAQIEHLAEYFEDSNEDFIDDYLQADREDRDEAAGEFVIKWTEFLYGRFSKAQREQLARDVAALPMSAQDVHDERVRLQKELLVIVRQAVSPQATQAQVEQALRTTIDQTVKPRQEPQRARLNQWIRAGCELAARTHNGTTAEQRNKVTATLNSWEKDVRILAKEL